MNKPRTAFFYLLLISGLLIPDTSKAEVSLPAIVSSNMVLQRNTTITLWGWADSEEALEITASWLKKPIKIAADHAGDWKVEVQTTGSKEPQTIKIDSVWAGHPVGFSLYTHGNRQYIAYYNANRNTVVGQRDLDEKKFEQQKKQDSAKNKLENKKINKQNTSKT